MSLTLSCHQYCILTRTPLGYPPVAPCHADPVALGQQDQPFCMLQPGVTDDTDFWGGTTWSWVVAERIYLTGLLRLHWVLHSALAVLGLLLFCSCGWLVSHHNHTPRASSIVRHRAQAPKCCCHSVAHSVAGPPPLLSRPCAVNSTEMNFSVQTLLLTMW